MSSSTSPPPHALGGRGASRGAQGGLLSGSDFAVGDFAGGEGEGEVKEIIFVISAQSRRLGGVQEGYSEPKTKQKTGSTKL